MNIGKKAYNFRYTELLFCMILIISCSLPMQETLLVSIYIPVLQYVISRLQCELCGEGQC